MGLAKGHSMAVATIAICLPLLWWFQSPGQGIVLDQVCGLALEAHRVACR